VPNDRGQVSPSTTDRIPPAVRGALFVSTPWTALLLPPPWSVVLVVLISVVVGAFLVRDPQADRGVLLTVAAFTACDVSPLSVSGSVVRLYQLSGLLVLVVVFRRRAEIGRGLRELGRLPAAVVGVVVGLTVLTPLSLLWTISPRDTLVSTVGQLSATGLLVLFAAAVSSGLLRARDVLGAVWAMASLNSLVACAQFVLTMLTPWQLAGAGGSGVPWPRPEGLMTEAVWAALVAATGLALAFVVRHEHRRLSAGSMVLHITTIGLVSSRAVLLGIVGGALVCMFVVWRRRVSPLRLATVAAASLVAVLVLAVAAPSFLARFDPRLVLGLRSGSDGGSAASRAAVYELVADELPPRLPLGGGAGSLNKLTTDPEIREQYIGGGDLNAGRGSTNFFLGYVFDFGYLGAALSVTLVILVGVLAVAVARVDQGLSAFLATLYLVDFQFNNGFRFGFVHVLLGVLIGVASMTRLEPSGRRSGAARHRR